jgi:hypothetical protein
LRSSNRASQLSQAEFIPRERFSPLGVSGPHGFPLSFAPTQARALLCRPRALLCPSPVLFSPPARPRLSSPLAAALEFLARGGGVCRRNSASWRSSTSRRVAAELGLQAHGGGARRRDSVSWHGATWLGAWRRLASPAAAPLAGGGGRARARSLHGLDRFLIL